MRVYKLDSYTSLKSKGVEASDRKISNKMANVYSFGEKRKQVNFEKAKENMKLAAAQLDW